MGTTVVSSSSCSFLHSFLFLPLLLLLPSLQNVRCVPTSSSGDDVPRKDFPLHFVFGAGTSAYQYEGAAAEDGRSPSIWDTFTHQGRINNSTADVAADGYHNYKEDVTLMSEINLEAYKFSISWSRLIPNGRGAINPKGLKYYNDLIDELISKGIEPHIVLYQLDLPQILEDEYDGWISPRIIDDFTAYADVCFKEFGDRVTHWTTIDEPNIIATSYDNGAFAPGRCSDPYCATPGQGQQGDSTTEPYIVLKNVLLAHASAYQLYKSKYQATQKGTVGVNVYTITLSPQTNSEADIEATKRAKDFMMGWMLDPLVYGDYPKTMKEIVGHRLPLFTPDESQLVKGSFDFLGINYYSSIFVTNDNYSDNLRDYNADMRVKFAGSKSDTPSSGYIPHNPYADPSGLQNVLEYLQLDYNNPTIYIQESGFGKPYNSTLDDDDRIIVLKAYIGVVLSTMRNGLNVKGYFVWAFVDVFEFLYGYETRYGLYHVDFEDLNRKRMPKKSAFWYKDFLMRDKAPNIRSVGLQESPSSAY